MKSSYLYLMLVCAWVGCFSSCRGSKETAASGLSGVRKVACGKVAIEPDVPHIDWFETSGITFDKDKEENLPAAYKVYSLEEVQLQRFFEAAVAEEHMKQVKTVIPLGSMNCQVFLLRKSDTVPEGLGEKYPQIVSLSGTGINGTGDLRLDFDGTKINGQVIWKNDVYLITPIEHSKKIYYIIYKKSDSMEQKQPFESEHK